MTDDKTPPPPAPDPREDSAASQSAPIPGSAPLKLDARAMKAFSHPLRMAIYGFLNDVEAATATTLARHLHESTGQTSYHLRQLEKHGLVEEVPGRGTGRERWWTSVGFKLPAEEFSGDPDTRGPLTAIMQAQLRQRVEALRRWYADHLSAGQDWIDASVENTGTFVMTAGQTRALSEELMTVIERHRAAAKEEAAADSTDEATEGTTPGITGSESRRVRLYLSIFPLPREDEIIDGQ